MKFYLAPMEGITGYIYRNAYDKFFTGFDEYFTPFITPNGSKSLKTKELKDVLPMNNTGLKIIPQILTNHWEGFTDTSLKLREFGYNHVNLNLGCPSKTVVSKGRGSGFLAKPKELDIFLDEIFKIHDLKISIKTRIGKDEPEEFYELIKIYNKYPIEELIIHPRVQKDFYGNKPNLNIFKAALELSTNPVCYNGDIFTVSDYDKIIKTFPEVSSVMLGRGILANPNLLNAIKNNTVLDKSLFKSFHDEILNKYMEAFNDEIITLFRMKELWGYMIYIFSDNKKQWKKIKKAQKLSAYNEIVQSIFEEQEIIQGAGLFHNEL